MLIPHCQGILTGVELDWIFNSPAIKSFLNYLNSRMSLRIMSFGFEACLVIQKYSTFLLFFYLRGEHSPRVILRPVEEGECNGLLPAKLNVVCLSIKR